jgi:deferrochelatase/peroxidase EfeB
VLPGIARVSLGIGNNEDDIDALISALRRIMRQPRAALKADVKKQMDDFIMEAARRVYL